jgi:hypothetical protein
MLGEEKKDKRRFTMLALKVNALFSLTQVLLNIIKLELKIETLMHYIKDCKARKENH